MSLVETEMSENPNQPMISDFVDAERSHPTLGIAG